MTRAAVPRLTAVLIVFALLALAPSASAFIYWSNTGSTIGRANPDGSGAVQNFITGANEPCGVAVDTSHIFWPNDAGASIGRALLDGSGVTQSFISGAGGNPCGVAVDSAHIYWTDTQATGFLARANLDGSSPDTNFIPSLNYPCGVAVDSHFIYWANRDASSISRANLDGSSPDPNFITTGVTKPCGVAVDGSHVYWANFGSTTIGRANLDGGSPNGSFITGASAPCGVAADATSVYWANSSANSIGRANLDGSGTNQSLVTGANIPCWVAADVPVPPPPPPQPLPVVPAMPNLAITNLRLHPSRFPAANAGDSIARKRRRATGTMVRYNDSQAATARLTVLKARRGVKVKGKCVAMPIRKNKTNGTHRRSFKRCTRYVTVGTFTHTDTAGLNTFHFTGRVGGRKLRSARYRLVAVPVLGTRTGSSDSARFRVSL